MIAEPPVLSGTLSPDDIVRAVKHLPSAPKVLPRLKALLADTNSTLSEIVALVRLDPGIAARVLQTANSAYFSKGVRCTTVEEAVNRVGYEQIYELVAHAVASQVLVRPLETYNIEADELWKMSVSCALAAEAIAGRAGLDRDSAYTMGLLHCVGMVALDEWSLRGRHNILFRTMGFPREAVESERAALGFTHADVGSALLTHWEFPTTISEPVRSQHAPRASETHAKLASLLYLAKWVRSTVCAPTIASRPLLPDTVQMYLPGVNATALKAIVGDVALKIAAVDSLLDAGKQTVERHRFPSQRWSN
jgi:HD-like signal output (HDOD) protein